MNKILVLFLLSFCLVSSERNVKEDVDGTNDSYGKRTTQATQKLICPENSAITRINRTKSFDGTTSKIKVLFAVECHKLQTCQDKCEWTKYCSTDRYGNGSYLAGFASYYASNKTTDIHLLLLCCNSTGLISTCEHEQNLSQINPSKKITSSGTAFYQNVSIKDDQTSWSTIAPCTSNISKKYANASCVREGNSNSPKAKGDSGPAGIAPAQMAAQMFSMFSGLMIFGLMRTSFAPSPAAASTASTNSTASFTGSASTQMSTSMASTSTTSSTTTTTTTTPTTTTTTPTTTTTTVDPCIPVDSTWPYGYTCQAGCCLDQEMAGVPGGAPSMQDLATRFCNTDVKCLAIDLDGTYGETYTIVPCAKGFNNKGTYCTKIPTCFP